MHRVAIECKNYTNFVSLGKLRDFLGVLEDIGNIAGIFVTKQGYQSGAITYAKNKGISLKTVQEPIEEDINSHQEIKEIGIIVHKLSIGNVRFEFLFDLDWIKENTSFKKGDTISLREMTDEIKVIDSRFNLIGTLHDIENKLPIGGNCQDLAYTEKFDDGFLVETTLKYKPLKIHAINFIYDTYEVSLTSAIKFKLMGQALVKDILTENTYLFNRTIDLVSHQYSVVPLNR